MSSGSVVAPSPVRLQCGSLVNIIEIRGALGGVADADLAERRQIVCINRRCVTGSFDVRVLCRSSLVYVVATNERCFFGCRSEFDDRVVNPDCNPFNLHTTNADQ
jgi:hypothetical protein